MSSDWLARLCQGLRRAFSLQSPHGPLTDEDRRFITRLADSIVARGLSTVAIMALTAFVPSPVGGLAGQSMVFLKPFHGLLHSVFRPFLDRLFDEKLIANDAEYDRLAAIIERREGVEAMVQEIERAQELNKDLRK